jgi:ABC-type enterochelin transport system substrate-binding protein
MNTAPRGALQSTLIDRHRERLNANIVNIVCLIKDNDALLLELSRNKIANFGIQHVLVVVHDDIRPVDRLINIPLEETGQEGREEDEHTRRVKK